MVPRAEVAKLVSVADVLTVRVDPIGQSVFRRVLVRRTRHGFVALGSQCPHSGCEVMSHPEGFECPCHGSGFDVRGERLFGPAMRGLARAPVSEEPDGLVIEVGR